MDPLDPLSEADLARQWLIGEQLMLAVSIRCDNDVLEVRRAMALM